MSLTGLPFQFLAIVGSSLVAKHVLSVTCEFPTIGVGLILRDPLHDPERVMELANDLLRVDIPSNTTLLTNSCLVEGITWRHLTSSELKEEKIPSGTFGCSVHNLEEASHAESVGAQYVTYSPVFTTSSKPATEPVGLTGLRKCLESLSIPVIALGGIDSVEKAMACIKVGVGGVAGIRLSLPENSKGLIEILEAIKRYSIEIRVKC